MSGFESNPFADPHASNPFADHSVQEASRQGYRVEPVEEFNPFAEDQFVSKTVASQPAVLQTSPPAYTPPEPQPSQAATDYLQQRQEELERKAAELDRREQAMHQNLLVAARVSNFPPLPARFPVKPCFYQDISTDIPLQFQRLVRFHFVFWLIYIGVLFINIWVSVAYFSVSTQYGVDNLSGSTLGLSVLYFVLWTPASYVCWFRSVYNAFRMDSSFFFFAYFFIFVMQFCANVVQAIGPNGSGTVGWVSGLSMVTYTKDGKRYNPVVAMGIVMVIIGIFFTILAVICMLLLLRVHRLYRSTGGNFAKAQQEFAQGVVSNRNVQQAAGNLAASAAQGAAQSAAQGAFNGGNSRDPRY